MSEDSTKTKRKICPNCKPKELQEVLGDDYETIYLHTDGSECEGEKMSDLHNCDYCGKEVEYDDLTHTYIDNERSLCEACNEEFTQLVVSTGRRWISKGYCCTGVNK